MTRRITIGAALITGVAALCAGCGTPAASRPPAVARGAGQSLAYSEATSGATWAVLPMGAASGPNQFWQLFLRTAGQSRWTLHTPPDISTSGALALGGLAGAALVLAVRPSLYLAFSPVSLTADGGRHWAAGPPAQGLAAIPDALAATPGGRRLLTIGKSGQVSASSATRHGWTPVITAHSLGASRAARACGLTGLSAVSYSPGGEPLLAGGCSHPGVAGIFSQAGSTWRASGPPLPASLAGTRVQVLRMVTSRSQTTALLLARGGANSIVAAAWLGTSGQWTVSSPLPLGGATVSTTAFGPAGGVAVVLSGGRAEILSGPGGSWARTPPVPAGHAVTIALPGDGPAQALAATGSTLTVWDLGTSTWTRARPSRYRSSTDHPASRPRWRHDRRRADRARVLRKPRRGISPCFINPVGVFGSANAWDIISTHLFLQWLNRCLVRAESRAEAPCLKQAISQLALDW